ncbi:GNAT family N-acetyltransferase [Flavivirga spongiicola]|uniref:GNAT family N-acetyltransferase n=1 Tax=Flavivirga spongiicola TaxID=421621 RepID=A0ABU7XNN5_9FLAO|nr:GNAT family N-acetyltransferase [Flavivirga sp. MEBiC05379]MDO5981722.1 GNAT family N-acetyltransferase [Flavivirga sp. MEBiC05379]
MGIKEAQTISSTRRYWSIIRNGLFLFGLRNRLARIGLDIKPYYWVEEEVEACDEPIINGDASEYKVRYLNLEEIKLIAKDKPKEHLTDMIKGFENGQLCIGLEREKEIAAYTYVELNDFVFNKRSFKLEQDEAYLLNMWTFHSFRGKNLAPYLRYQSYQLLKEKGIHKKYSITEYFNKSSIKFKKKLNSKHLTLFLSIVLFKKYYWNFTLRKY